MLRLHVYWSLDLLPSYNDTEEMSEVKKTYEVALSAGQKVKYVFELVHIIFVTIFSVFYIISSPTIMWTDGNNNKKWVQSDLSTNMFMVNNSQDNMFYTNEISYPCVEGSLLLVP